MKITVYFLALILLVTSCSVKKKPIFLKVDDFKLLSFKMDTIKMQANAFFKNENDIGGKISTDQISVLVDGKEVAKVSSKEFKVPANKEFAVPLKVVMPTKKIFGKGNSGVLGGLLNSVLKNNVEVQFKGDIKYKVLGFSSVYKIDKKEKIKL